MLRFCSTAFVGACLAVAIMATAQAASASTSSSWRTVARASDVGSYSTYAYFSRDVRNPLALRVRAWAPRGALRVSGSLYCWSVDYLSSGSRSFGFRLRSRGRRYPLTRSLVLPIAGGAGVTCHVSADATGKAGRLTLYLQALTAA